jgi:thioredoxin reductase (NADPH)
VVVDEDEQARDELLSRYAAGYDIVRWSSAAEAVAGLDDLSDRGTEVALVLVAIPGPADASELLAHADRRYPSCKRAFLVDFGAWGSPDAAAEIRRGIATGIADYYAIRPWCRDDEQFHRTITDMLYEYSRLNPTARPREFAVIAEPWQPEGHELLQLLSRNGIPHVHYEPDAPEAHALLDPHGGGVLLPAVVTPQGRLLERPTARDLARQYGVSTELPERSDFDLVVVGAGPAGLAAAISAAAEGLSVMVIEGRAIGGQASTSSRIRNYLGFSRGVTGAELAQRAYQQAWALGVEFLHMNEATGLGSEGDQHVVTLRDGGTVRASAVLLAMGVTYRRHEAPGIETLLGRGVYYGASVSEARSLRGAEVFVVGGGNSAGQAALHMARSARTVTIVTRKRTLGATMSRYLRDEIDATRNIVVRQECILLDGGGDARLEWLVLREGDEEERLDADAVFMFIGGVPRTGWLPGHIRRDESGYVITGEAGHEDDEPGSSTMFETSVPGVFAVGDVRSGSVKRIASAVGEGSVVVPHLMAHVARVAAGREGR